MKSKFEAHLGIVKQAFKKLCHAKPYKRHSLPIEEVPQAGIYLFSKQSKHLYVGRSNRLRSRIMNHSRPSASPFQASFAFLIARKATGLTATYDRKGSRKDLLTNPKFETAFCKAKTNIAEMDIRFVKEDNPIRQALLEIYASILLRTEYNDFDTH